MYDMFSWEHSLAFLLIHHVSLHDSNWVKRLKSRDIYITKLVILYKHIIFHK